MFHHSYIPSVCPRRTGAFSSLEILSPWASPPLERDSQWTRELAARALSHGSCHPLIGKQPAFGGFKLTNKNYWSGGSIMFKNPKQRLKRKITTQLCIGAHQVCSAFPCSFRKTHKLQRSQAPARSISSALHYLWISIEYPDMKVQVCNVDFGFQSSA